MKSALWRGRGYLGRTNAERNDRYAKQSTPAVHISIRFQSEGQFNCGGRPTRPSAIFSASNRPPETVNVCARAPPNDIYIYIDTVLERVLEQRPTLKCICGAGLTTNFKFFPARSACTDTHKPIPTLAEWREHGSPPLAEQGYRVTDANCSTQVPDDRFGLPLLASLCASTGGVMR